MPQILLRKIVASLLLLSGLAGAATASASGFSNMYVFGDSLSDSGNVFALTGYPPEPYWNGRFSNGPTYAENLAGMLGFTAAPALLGGTNYAFGGATAGPGSAIGPFAFDLGSQVNAFRSVAGPADSDALYVVWAGANDLRTNPTPAGMLGALSGVSGAIQGLYAEGARNFLVMNLPNLGLTPEATHANVNDPATLGSALFDTFFGGVVGGLRSSLIGSNIRMLDTFGLLNNVVDNPQAYGLSNVTDNCILAGAACNPNSYLFWDEVHPTAAGHRIIADAAYKVLAVPEPSTYALLFAGLGLISITVRRRGKHQA